MSGAVAVVGFASIGGILFGLDQGNWAGAIVKPKFVDTFCGTDPACISSELPKEYENFLSWASALLQVGAAIAAVFLAPYMARTFGRREAMFFGCLITIAGIVPLTFVGDKTLFCVFRVIAGLGVGHVTYSLPMFISEVAPVKIRGILGSMFQFTVVCGLVVGALLNVIPSFTYSLSFSLPCYPAAIVALGIFFFPRSPRFALLHGQRRGRPEHGAEQARRSLRRLRGSDEAADAELQELQATVAKEANTEPYSTLWRDRSIRYRVFVANFLQWGQQFTGVNAILSYGPSIFKAAGVPLDPIISSAIVNICMLLGTCVVLTLIDKWGRRILLLTGGTVMFLALAASTALAWRINDITGGADVSTLDEHIKSEVRPLGYILLCSVCVYGFGFAPWGAVPWIYPSEIFPMDVKEKAMSTSVCSQWLANFLIAFLVPHQVNLLKAWGTLLFYCVCCLIVVVSVFFAVPEVKGVELERMDTVFGPRSTGHAAREALVQA